MIDDPVFDSYMSQLDQNVQMESFYTSEPLVLKVHFWDVAHDDGNNPQPLQEGNMLDVVANLNRQYNEINIFFKYDGKSQLNSSYFRMIDTDPELGQTAAFIDFIDVNNYYELGAINMYSIFDLSGGAYFQKQANGKFGTIVSTVWNYDSDGDILFTHEVGHFFNLHHTFSCGPFGDTCENVTRDISNPEYDAHTQGDKVVDTNATPMGLSNYEGYNSDCEYTGNHVDEEGQPYSDHEPEIKNFMGYSDGCEQEFTAGQVFRMRSYIEFWANHPTVTIVRLNPVSILYRPYTGRYYLSGPATNDPPLFQYGFDYTFVDTTQAEVYNEPSEYEDTSFWTGSLVSSYNSAYNTPIEHINHTAFRIEQLNSIQPRMCYNNFNRNPDSGSVIKFLDGVPNTNVTITHQDSTQINNTYLIDDLAPGLYNIQKNYIDGSTDATMILKGNN